MSKRRDIRLHEVTLDSLDEIKGRLDTLIDYHEQANNQRVAAEKLANPVQIVAGPGFWEQQCREKDVQPNQTLAVKKLLASERATLSQRVAFLEAACDEWAEKCRKDYDNLGGQLTEALQKADAWAEKHRICEANYCAQIRSLKQSSDAWQVEAGRQLDRAEGLLKERDKAGKDCILWQARCNNACQKLSELQADTTYNGIQVDCPETRTKLDSTLSAFLNRKKKAVHCG